MAKVRRKYVFRGRVQGVGFRYTVSGFGRDLGLTGWVRNEYDGSVEMEVQGEEALIDRMIMKIHNVSRFISIEDMEVKRIPLVENEKRFSVRY